MRLILSKEMVNNLPIHDALFYSFSVIQDLNGKSNMIFNIEFTDDSYECGFVIPQKNKITQLIFENSWLIKNEFICDSTNRDSIFSFTLIEESTDLTEFKSRGAKNSICQYHLELNSGSQFDIISEQLYLVMKNKGDASIF